MEFIDNITTSWIIIFIFTGFLAGYIDSIAGGGGMIQVPVLLYSGIPPVFVLATNKTAGMFGALMATIRYSMSKKVNWRVVFIAIIPCLLASYLGSYLVMYIPQGVIQWAILLSIAIAMIALFKKSKTIKEENITLSNKNIIFSTAPIGFYDGLLGPGTGTYLTISMKKFLNLDFLVSTASTKPLNFATNLGSFLAFFFCCKNHLDSCTSYGSCKYFGFICRNSLCYKRRRSFYKKSFDFSFNSNASCQYCKDAFLDWNKYCIYYLYKVRKFFKLLLSFHLYNFT